MAAEQNPTTTSPADLAQAFKDLAKGEMTASAMENQLTSLERKIDELLASVDKKEMDGPGPKGNASTDMKGGKGEGI